MVFKTDVQKVSHRQFNFNNGVNHLAPNGSLHANGEARDLTDIRVAGSACRKREGYTTWEAVALTTSAVHTLDVAWKNGTPYVLGGAGGELKQSTGGGWTKVKTGATSGKQWDIAVMSNMAYMCNGYDIPQMWDFSVSSGVSMSTYSPVIPRYFETHRDRLFAAGLNTSTLYFSEWSQPQLWYSDYAINVGEGDTIVQLVSWKGIMFVFKNNTIWRISGDSPYSYTTDGAPIQSGFDGICGESIVVIGDFIFFCDRNGIWQFNGVDARIVSHKVWNYFHKQINLTALPTVARGAHNPSLNLYMLCVPTGSSSVNNYCIVYDYEKNIFWGMWSLSMASMKWFKTNLLMGTSGSAGLVYKLYTPYDSPAANKFNNNGTGFRPVITTEQVDFGIPDKTKTVTFLEIQAAAASSACSLKAEFTTEKVALDTFRTINLSTSGLLDGDRSTASGTRATVCYPAIPEATILSANDLEAKLLTFTFTLADSGNNSGSLFGVFAGFGVEGYLTNREA